MKLVRLLANLGYGSRKQVAGLIAQGWVTGPDGQPLSADARVPHADIRLDGEPLDPAPGMVIAMNKPVGYTCSLRDAGRLVFDLLPPRFRLRKPALSSIGRLDRDTSGLLLFTDDGQRLHRIISPRSAIAKTYRVGLAEDLRGHEAELFAAGELLLEGETRALLPARLQVQSPRSALLTISEGRYHQVRRMFAATGNAVATLERIAIGGLELSALALEPGQWRLLDADQIDTVFQAPVA
ncbi:MAG: rRNA pseudouridine synthase [Xanthomonadales bacterium]|nr:rRNA pseudouridine synthase [Xanthomonadales bacterium]